MRIRPTVLGWKSLLFIGVITFVYFAAPYSNLYYLLLAFACVLGVTNTLSTVRNVSGVRGHVDSIAPVAAGAPLRVIADLDARARTRFGLKVVLAVNGGRSETVARAALTEGGKLEGLHPPLKRGVHSIRSARVESIWPLGMLRAGLPLDAPRDLVVYPAPLDLLAESSAGGAGGDDGVAVAEAGMLQPSSLREYRAGDSLKRIHWRAMARRGRPVVTEWEAGAGEGFEFVLDRRAAESALEHALSLLVTLATQARDLKEPFTLHSQGLSATFGGSNGNRPWDALWRFLAGADALGAGDPPPPPAGPHVPRLPSATGGGA